MTPEISHRHETKTKDEANLKRLETTSSNRQEQLPQGNKIHANNLSKRKLPFQMTNHEIGCELECYIEILEYRGYKMEARQLLEIASRIK